MSLAMQGLMNFTGDSLVTVTTTLECNAIDIFKLHI